ncbi:DUF1573 domain-containing protein [Spirosoma knui]
MKRILFLVSVVALTVSVAMTEAVAIFKWASTTHDFGRIEQGKPVTAKFTFTNTGDLPLVINTARGSCGCTGVDFSKDPIMPGQSGSVKATFNAAAPGAFSKTVTVESNAEGGLTVLHFKGEVVSKAPVGQ